ncbi:hypothetical protein ACFQ12_08545, partial [Methylobacterium trifolii]
MRLRGLLIGAFGLSVAAVAATIALPHVAERGARLIEDRLRQETGLAWTVGRLGFEAAPALVLHDVAVADGTGEGVRGTLREVRLTGPIGLLFGGSGTAQAAIADARLRLPTALRFEAGRGDPGPSLAGLRAVLRGADATLADRAIALTVRSLDLAVDLGDKAVDAPPLRIELADLGAVLDIGSSASGVRPLRFAWNPSEGRGPRISASANADLRPNALRIDGISGSIDRAPFSGSLGLESGPKPRLALDLRLDALALTDAASPPPRTPADGTLTVPVRADMVPDPAWFALFDGQASLAIKRLELGPVQLAAVALTARVADGSLDAGLDGATLYSGSARGRYVLSPDPGGAGRHQLGLSLTRVRVQPLLTDVVGIQGLDGAGTARIDLQAVGSRPEALLGGAS